MQTVNFTTTQGVLEEIQDAANEFLVKRNVAETTTRLRATDQALKQHALEHIKERFNTIQIEKQQKVLDRQALLQEDTFK